MERLDLADVNTENDFRRTWISDMRTCIRSAGSLPENEIR